MKIQINTPDISRLAGVANFYRVLRPAFPENVRYFTIHVSLPGVLKLFAFVYDLFRYSFQMMCGKIDVVLLNPSLGKGAVIRDGLYAWITKNIFHRNFYVHWHGWQESCEKLIDNGKYRFFIDALFSSDGMFVLAEKFKKTLVRWGYEPDRIYITTTAIEDSVCLTPRSYNDKTSWTILFLARLVKEKGIFVAIDACDILVEKHKNLNFRLLVAGDGPDLKCAKEYALSKGLKCIEFLGYVKDDSKDNSFLNGDIYILPSFHEGMPCSLLEAMGYGLPVITNGVGGIPDFFENGQMGFMIDSLDPSDYAEAIERLLNDPKLIEQMGRYNRQYALEHFTATKVAAKVLHYMCESK